MEVKLSKQQKVTVNGAEDIYPIMRQILRRENKIVRSGTLRIVGLNRQPRSSDIELVARFCQHGEHQTQRSLPYGDLAAGCSGDYGP